MKAIAILTTVLLKSVHASTKNVFDTEQLLATNFVANEENFGPASDSELLIVNNDITSDVANEESFLPPLDDAKYFQVHSLYEIDGTQICLQPRSKYQGSTIVVKPCLDEVSRSLQWWKVDEVGQFRNKANPDLCMTRAPESKLKLKPCLERDSTTKLGTSVFIYNYFTNQIHYTRNPLRIVTVPHDLIFLVDV